MYISQYTLCIDLYTCIYTCILVKCTCTLYTVHVCINLHVHVHVYYSSVLPRIFRVVVGFYIAFSAVYTVYT